LIYKLILFDIIPKVALTALAICGVSLYLSDGSFWIYALICAGFFIAFIAIAIFKAEDQVTFTSGGDGKRPFMLFAHSTIYAFILGIIILILQFKGIVPSF